MERRLALHGIASIDDLLATYPRDYHDWREPKPISTIVREALERAQRHEEPAEEIAVGEVVHVREMRTRVALVVTQLEQDGARITATWFGRRGLHLEPGQRVFVHGRVALKRKAGAAAVEMSVMHHRVLGEGQEYRGTVVPIYRASKDLPSRALGAIFEKNLDRLAGLVQEIVPQSLLTRHGYPLRRVAWREAHQPRTPESAAVAKERLVYEEFLGIALAAAVKRAQRMEAKGARAIATPPGLLAEFEATLPFALTRAQREAIGQIWRDMGNEAPMNRLLQGDVGSGKTLVAAAAVILAARNGVQSALMAPTEILAAQHAARLAPLLLPFGVTVDAVFGSMGARERRSSENRIRSGEALLAVGTHALFSQSVQFAQLGLAVIDEQHRFGVLQRAALRAKSRAPHTLHMTATPIPRTLAQVKYADMDLAILDELPPGRAPVETFVLRESRKDRGYELIRRIVERGGQAYVVAPAIDESDEPSESKGSNEWKRAATSALAELEHLRTEVFPDLRVGLLHGRLATREKDDAMRRFAAGELDVLLATTVVEVGVDVPNATVMVVLDAQLFGLAQLHQLRGRVGRGAVQSYCVLIAPDDRPAFERLEILERTNDGFLIAEEDLRLRGEGEFAGTAQTGTAAGPLGNLVTDFALYMKAKADADRIVAEDPELKTTEYAPLRALLHDEATQRAVAVTS